MTIPSDIFSSQPPWILRRGMLLLAVFLLLLVLLAWLIRYPDVYQVPVQLEGEAPSLSLHAPAQGGQLEALLVPSGSRVEADSLLAVFAHDGNWRDVQTLRDALLTSTEAPSSLRLGILQAAYNQWQIQTQRSLGNSPAGLAARMDIRLAQKRLLQEQLVHLQEQLRLAREEAVLSLEALNRDSLLYGRGAVSLIELNFSRREWLRARQLEEELQRRSFELRQQIQSLEEGSQEIRTEFQREQAQQRTEQQAAREQLLAAIETWERNYLMRSPRSGQVQWLSTLQPGQTLAPSQVLGNILPNSQSTVLAVGTLPPEGVGRVRQGQVVYLRLDAYPYQEYGQVKGTVLAVAQLPENGRFPVRAAFELPLQSSYGKPLPHHPGWSGELRILTDDRRLLNRIFDLFRSAVVH